MVFTVCAGFYMVFGDCLGVATQPATSESSKEKFYTMRRIITLALLALFCVAVVELPRAWDQE